MEFTPEETEGLGKIPSGLFIVAVKHDGEIDGFLASFIQQVSMKPLLVTLAMKPGRPAYDAIMAGKPFTINIVGDHDKSYLKLFWKGYDPNDNPFESLKYRETENGGIVLEQALASIDAVRKESYTPGDHDLVIAEVLASQVLAGEGKPLTHIRKNGLSY